MSLGRRWVPSAAAMATHGARPIGSKSLPTCPSSGVHVPAEHRRAGLALVPAPGMSS